jgi:hypothetical protein
MRTVITGLRRQRRLRGEVMKQLSDFLERRRLTPVSLRVGFFDDDGPRGGPSTRCALTVTPRRAPAIRVEHTARTYAAAFGGGFAVLKRQLKRHVQRRRRRVRYPTRPPRAGDITTRLRADRGGPRRKAA